MYWVSKVAEATVGAAERRADIQNEWHIVRNNFKKSGFNNGLILFQNFAQKFQIGVSHSIFGGRSSEKNMMGQMMSLFLTAEPSL